MQGYRLNSPLGDIALRIEHEHLTGLFFVGQQYFPDMPLGPLRSDAPPLARLAQAQIEAYFAGRRQDFELPLQLQGSAFERAVWQQLATIPYGTVTSYGAIAERLGLAAGYARAVGAAIGRNPVCVVVPCHRVVGARGQLTGYAGGVARKQALLALETGAAAMRSAPTRQTRAGPQP